MPAKESAPYGDDGPEAFVRLLGGFVVACAVDCAIDAGGQRPVPNVSLMASVGRYVEDYEQQLGAIIGDEDDTQVVSNPQGIRRRRQLQSEFALVRLPTDDRWWIGIRDVLQSTAAPCRTERNRSSRC